MKRDIKQGYEIVNDVWKLCKEATSVECYKDSAPLTAGGLPKSECVVVSLYDALANQAYNALVLVNIHVPNVCGVYPNEKRFVEIASELLQDMDYYSGDDFQLTTDVAGRLNRNSDGTHFYTLRFFYSTIIKEI